MGATERPVAWFAPDAPASSVFVPFFSDALSSGKYDVTSYGKGSMKVVSFTDGKLQPAWWAHNFVANWMEINYKNMSESYVYPLVRELQAKVIGDAQVAVTKASTHGDSVLGDAQTEIQRA